MGAYQYKAINEKGREKQGVLEGDTPKQVRKQLREMSLHPIHVTATATATKEAAVNINQSFRLRRSVSVVEIALITRQLATLVQAGLPLDEALTAVAQQCDKTRIKSVVLAVRAGVLEGKGLAESFALYPQVFDTLYCSMVAAGESSGHLGEVLIRLSEYTEQRQAMRQKTKLALLYPTILSAIAVLVVAGLLAFVVPKVIEQFATAEQSLPLATQILIVISDAVKNYWALAIGIIVVAISGMKWALKDKEFRLNYHKGLLALPVIGKVELNVNVSRFSRTLSILISSGVPLLDALKIGGRVVNNICLQQAIDEAANHVHEGASLNRALSETSYFPPMMLHMITNGEKSGDLDVMLEHVATNQEREHETMVTMALGLFEPLLILSMGGVVLFIVMAILLPIFELNTLIG